ncbi:MAG: hypothetical protein ACI87O_003107, partial [Planctomycetota bacterium]
RGIFSLRCCDGVYFSFSVVMGRLSFSGLLWG